MNKQKVVVGGLAAGVTLFVLDTLNNLFVTGNRWMAEMEALNPALPESMESAGTLAGFAVIDLVLGILLVWMYAAIRPTFGPGPKTAMIAGVVFFLLTGAVWASYPTMGIISWGMWAFAGVPWLITSFASAYVGGMVYKEQAS